MKKSANISFRLMVKLKRVLSSNRIVDYRDTPIIINNFNRLTYLQMLIKWLEKSGYENIFIIDNKSTYKPLIDYYHSIKYTVYKLDKNLGPYALWKTQLYLKFRGNYFVYTDPDILPIEDCPSNVIQTFFKYLDKYNDYQKVGFGLQIDDIPDHNADKQKVVNWESKFWENKIEDGLYVAGVDTTFALYRPYSLSGSEIPALRTDYPFIAKHLPWYENPTEMDEETLFYIDQASSASSWYKKSDSMYS